LLNHYKIENSQRISDDHLISFGLDCSYLKLISCDPLFKPFKLQQILSKIDIMRVIFRKDLQIDKTKFKFYRSHTKGYAMLTKNLQENKILILCS